MFKKNVTTPYQKTFLVLTEKINLNHCMYIIIAIIHDYMNIIIVYVVSLQQFFERA